MISLIMHDPWATRPLFSTFRVMVPAPDGDMCLASSEINPDDPYRRGFSSYELTRLMQRQRDH